MNPEAKIASEAASRAPARADIRTADADGIAAAAALLRAGRLVALPTETVYGLAADATDARAVAALFAAKNRPRFNPLIVHLADMKKAHEIGDFDALSAKLAERFWPGPLTLVVPRAKACPVAPLASAGLDTVALRLPAHPVMRDVIRACGRPLAAPSANPSGRLSPTRAEHVAAGLGDRAALILDGGPAAHGVESTVIRCIGGRAMQLRAGAIPRAAIAEVAGPVADGDEDGAARAPGQVHSHYAPRHRLRLDAQRVAPDEALLAFGPPIAGTPRISRNLSPTGDLVEAAAHLFEHLHSLDAADCTAIAVMAVPETGLGEAINDRLRRAATTTGDAAGNAT